MIIMGERKIRESNKTQSPKKLTLVDLSKEAKALDEYIEVSLLGGKYSVQVNKVFTNSRIQRFLLDVQDALLILRSEKVNMNDIGKYFTLYQMCLFKHFTDLPLKHLDTSNKKDVSKLLDVADQLLDLDIFSELLSALPQEEKKKIEEAVQNIEGMGNQLGELMLAATNNEAKKLEKLGLGIVDGDVQ